MQPQGLRKSGLGGNNMLSGAGAAIMGVNNYATTGGFSEPERVKMNIEEVIFHEQKLSNILDVSDFHFIFNCINYRISAIIPMHLCHVKIGGTSQKLQICIM